MKPITLFFLLSALALPLEAQRQARAAVLEPIVLTGMATRWSGSFAEWQVFTTDEETEGELRQTWLGREDWTAWQYRIGEATGNIRIKWAENPNEWEARGDNFIVSARTLFNNNFNEWRVSDGRHTVILQSRFRNAREEWMLRSDQHGWFEMYTAFEGDPRDWAIVDEMHEEIPLPMRVLLAFLVMINAVG